MDDGLTRCAEQAIEFADDIRHAPKDANLAMTWMHLSRLGKAYRKQEAALARVRAVLEEWQMLAAAVERVLGPVSRATMLMIGQLQAAIDGDERKGE
jgi:predicted DCC family thiol-disulfide oxidoreductase YuxK